VWQACCEHNGTQFNRIEYTSYFGTGFLRDRSGEYSGHSDLSDLLNARQEWHAVLDDVLEGTHEDVEAIMSSARSAATVKLHSHYFTF